MNLQKKNKVISENGEELNSQFQILSIDHQLGLVLESQGGNGRNTDYNRALEIILERLKDSNVKSIRIKIVSEDLIKFFKNPLNRTIEIDRSTNILLKGKDIIQLRKRIGSAVSKIKVNKATKGGSPVKRIQLISNGLGEKEWMSIALGNTLLSNEPYGEVFDSLDFEQQVDMLLEKSIETIPKGNRNPRKIERSSPEIIERDPNIKAWILQNAKGKCENCENNSPFQKLNGKPYLEVHHLKQLSNQGSDTIENTVALCPNCHKEFHFGINGNILLQKIYDKIPRLIKE